MMLMGRRCFIVFKHLSLDDRFKIEKYLNERKSFKEIGRLLNKNCTTISREIRRHSVIEKVVTAVSVLTLAYTRKPAKWVWCAEISVLKPLASCAEPADIVTTIALNLQSRFVS